jgi:hypothetical protein
MPSYDPDNVAKDNKAFARIFLLMSRSIAHQNPLEPIEDLDDLDSPPQ